MPWRRATETATVTEWERSDGNATIRLRERSDGTWAVRVDRLYQSAEGSDYRRETAETRAAALELVEALQAEYDVRDAA